MTAPRIQMPCRHCGKIAHFVVCAKYSTKYHVPDYDNYPYPVTWRILQCLECERPTLEQDVDARQLWADDIETTILYPQEQKPKEPLANLPTPVQKAYDAALKVRDTEPNFYAVGLGRTLEAACKHEGATKGTLAAMLKSLAASNKIPQTLARMAEQVTAFRNLGAHADERDEVTEQDIPAIEEFVEAILEYLYIAPAKIAAVEARLKRAKTP